MASLYMTAMMQLGLMHEEGGQPRIDMVARAADHRHAEPDRGKNQGQPHASGTKLSAELSLRIAHGLRGSHQRAGASAASRRHRSRETMKATLTVLGSGTSMGVPTIGCDCAVCQSSDPHDRRTRPSMLIEYDGKVGADRHHSRFSRAGDSREASGSWTQCSIRTPTPTIFLASMICGP